MVETLLRTSDRGQRWRGFAHFIFTLILLSGNSSCPRVPGEETETQRCQVILPVVFGELVRSEGRAPTASGCLQSSAVLSCLPNK